MTAENQVIGILAHVDAGKTTLAESILYLSGTIKKPGRVDHGNAYLDTDALEKARGITIFSKQARFTLGEAAATLLDTPGHVDFSAEMERTLRVLDYAILVISGTDGVTGHVMTLWKLLGRYHIPTFLFVNKMDLVSEDPTVIMNRLQQRLHSNCLDFTGTKDELFYENVVMCDERILEQFLNGQSIGKKEIGQLIVERKIFPCFFGSALKMNGVNELLEGLNQYRKTIHYPDTFGARVYKISRDPQGNRLTHLKITGGRLKVKMLLNGNDQHHHPWSEKVDQIRIYSGDQYEVVQEIGAGSVCAVTGLSATYAGAGLGSEQEVTKPMIESVLTYQVELPPCSDLHQMYQNLCLLEEEDPQLNITWEEESGEIHVRVMGEMQIEILQSLIAQRFNTEVTFGTGKIVYKETIREPVMGVGHFEPLRHYGEVHLLLEPQPSGMGLQFDSTCSEDMLDRNWQHLILTHLKEKQHRGVLTGAPITDVKITLVAGRAHIKHTEGGDFRQATYRAVRQGLKKAENILLEPIYQFRLEVPVDKVGRALADIQRMSGTFSPPVTDGAYAIVTGAAPVSEMADYQREVIAYTHGEGQLVCTLQGYQPCHNAQEIIEQMAYDSELDQENPTGSIFCAHGAGYFVPWDQVESHMHIDHRDIQRNNPSEAVAQPSRASAKSQSQSAQRPDEKELEEIFVRTYGAIEKPRIFKTYEAQSKPHEKTFHSPKKKSPKEEYLLVDGYNIIFSWPELKALAKINIASARDLLCDVLCNYQGYKQSTVILVYDAYRVEGQKETVETYQNIHIVYTRQAETADQYIAKAVKNIDHRYQVTVATSDRLEQLIIWGSGALRLSADGLMQEVGAVNQEIRTDYLEKSQNMRNYLLSKEQVAKLESENL